MSDAIARILPVTDDDDTAGFWLAADQDRLVVQSCANCANFLHLPKPRCERCGSWETRWQPVSGAGRLYSWTVVTHQVHAAFPVPYTLVLVELVDAPGVRLLGQLAGTPAVREGMPLAVRFEHVEPGVALPQWSIGADAAGRSDRVEGELAPAADNG